MANSVGMPWLNQSAAPAARPGVGGIDQNTLLAMLQAALRKQQGGQAPASPGYSWPPKGTPIGPGGVQWNALPKTAQSSVGMPWLNR